MTLAAKKYNELMQRVTVTEDMRTRILQNLQNADLEPEQPEQPAHTPRVLPFTRWRDSLALAACAALLLAGVLAVPSILDRQEGMLQASSSASQTAPSSSAGTDRQDMPASSVPEVAASEPESSSAAQTPATVWFATPDAPDDTEGPLLQGTPGDGSPGNTGSIESCETLSQLEDAVGFSVEGVSILPFRTRKVEYTAYWGKLAQIEYIGSHGQLACWRKSAGTTDNSGALTQWEKTEFFVQNGMRVTVCGDADGYSLAWWTDGHYSYSLTLSESLSLADWKVLLGQG